MRILNAALLALVLSTVARAQTSTTPTLPTTVYEHSISLIDASGNLVVIDHGVYLQNTTVTLRNGGTRTGVSRSPKTRIVVVRQSATEVMEYDGRIEVFAVGQKALYAVIDTASEGAVTRNLVALVTSAALPAAVGGFSSTPVNPYAALRSAGQDTFTIVDPPSASPRTGQVVAFNGAAFAVTSSASLP